MTDRKNGKKKLDLVKIRTQLDSSPAPQLWRGLEELAGTDHYKDFLHHEFPYHNKKDSGGISRRNILKLMGASAAMAGLSACTKLPTEKIVPYVQPPEEIIPGKPLFYATSMPFGGVANGLLLESHMGRPTKAEGNSQHPGSLGAADIFAQASVLGLWDPDRSQVVIHNGRLANWSDFLEYVGVLRLELAATRGAGFRILTETLTSPTLTAQLADLLKQFPEAQWHQHEPAGRDNVREGARLAFGEVVETPRAQLAYEGLLDGCLDFELAQALRRVFGYRDLDGLQLAAFLEAHETALSTGVSRPNMLTSTLSLPFSGLISSTLPWKSVNGPSTTRTDSPTWNSTRILGASCFICFWIVPP